MPTTAGTFTAAVERLRASAAVIAVVLLAAMGHAEILKGPYVLLEDAAVLRIRFEGDRPEYAVTLLHDGGERFSVLPNYTRSPRDTFLGDALVKLSPDRPLRGYEISRAGEPTRTYEWRSGIDGSLRGYPRLLVFGDSQGGSETLRRLGEQWGSETFDLIVGLGDLADAGSRYESWGEEFFEPLRDVLPHHPFLAICGNHDSYREKSLAWFDWFFGRGDRRRYFRIDFGDLRFIGLNNSDLHTKYGFDPIDPLTPQYDFLVDSALGATAQDKKIAVFCHVPIVSGSTVVNTEFGSAAQRKYILPIVERARVLGFFAGHHHKFERVALPGLRGAVQHIVTGGGGGRLFTAAGERGGFAMDREVFEVNHYLMVDFAAGSVVARALGGAEIDRVTFDPPADAEGTALNYEFWRAGVRADLSLTPGARIGDTLTIVGAPKSAPASSTHAQILRTERGLVGLVRNIGATGAKSVSFQGYDWPRKTWSYLQGGTLVLPAADFYATMALIAMNGADFSPLERGLPVLHWPLAGVRAGLDEEHGAALLLRGRSDFEQDPDPGRVIAKWRWGGRGVGQLGEEQHARQWSLMKAAPAPLRPQPVTMAELFQRVTREGRPEAFVLRQGDDPPAAVLLHWPDWRCLALVDGASLGTANGSIFVSTADEVRIETHTASQDEATEFRITRENTEPLLVPLSIGRHSP